jgi:hypothetical protein
MKKIIVYILLFQLGLIFSGCKKEIPGYTGKEGVYFAVQNGLAIYSATSWPYQPSSNVEFVRIGKAQVDFSLKVTITGPVKDYDRTFRVEVNPDSTTAVLGQHYETIKNDWIIPAGAISTNIVVRLKRTPDLQQTTKTLGLRLVATKDFSLSFPEWDAIPSLTGGTVVKEFDASLHSLKINDVMVQPVVWPGSIQPVNKESGLFGAFTRKKMEFMIQNLGLTYEDFSSADTMPQARYLLVAADASAILRARFDAKNPVLEDDGRLMFIGSVPWTSIIGVPYVP